MFLLFAWLSLKYLKLLAYSLTFNIDKKSDVKKQSCIIYICLIYSSSFILITYCWIIFFSIFT